MRSTTLNRALRVKIDKKVFAFIVFCLASPTTQKLNSSACDSAVNIEWQSVATPQTQIKRIQASGRKLIWPFSVALGNKYIVGVWVANKQIKEAMPVRSEQRNWISDTTRLD